MLEGIVELSGGHPEIEGGNEGLGGSIIERKYLDPQNTWNTIVEAVRPRGELKEPFQSLYSSLAVRNNLKLYQCEPQNSASLAFLI